MKSSMTRRLLIIFSILASLLLLVVVVMAVVVFLMASMSQTDIPSREEFDYRSTRFNPESNDISRSIATLPREMKEDEFYYYPDDDGNYFLISNFGAKEYKCTGECVCETDNSERRGLAEFVIVVSLITLYDAFAGNLAQTCQERLKGRCPLRNIVAKTGECKDPKSEPEEEKDYEEIVCTYECGAYCIPGIEKAYYRGGPYETKMGLDWVGLRQHCKKKGKIRVWYQGECNEELWKARIREELRPLCFDPIGFNQISLPDDSTGLFGHCQQGGGEHSNVYCVDVDNKKYYRGSSSQEM